MTEHELIEKLKKIEVLHAGATTEGERDAAEAAADRIRKRLLSYKGLGEKEFTFPLADIWHRKLFIALLRRYGLTPYRRHGRRNTTVVAKINERFLAETLWPEFQSMSLALQSYMNSVTDRIISETLHPDVSEEAIAEIE